MKHVLTVAAALLLATPAAADWSPGRAAAGPWQPDTAFPSTPPIQRYGKGRKGLSRFGRGQISEAEFRRFQEDRAAFRPAAARMEDSRGKCDRRLKSALDSGDRQALAEARDYCSPKAYGPQLR